MQILYYFLLFENNTEFRWIILKNLQKNNKVNINIQLLKIQFNSIPPNVINSNRLFF